MWPICEKYVRTGNNGVDVSTDCFGDVGKLKLAGGRSSVALATPTATPVTFAASSAATPARSSTMTNCSNDIRATAAVDVRHTRDIVTSGGVVLPDASRLRPYEETFAATVRLVLEHAR